MVKSKFNFFSIWLEIVIVCFCSIMLIVIISKYCFDFQIIKIRIGGIGSFVLQVTCFFAVLFFMIFSLSNTVITIQINKFEKTILFKKDISKKIRIFSFRDFDGFSNITVKHNFGKGNYKDYEAIGLIKELSSAETIDSYYYSNFDELREAINNMPYVESTEFVSDN
jgi:hypothetical protein